MLFRIIAVSLNIPCCVFHVVAYVASIWLWPAPHILLFSTTAPSDVNTGFDWLLSALVPFKIDIFLFLSSWLQIQESCRLQKVAYVHPLVFSLEGSRIVLRNAATQPTARSFCGEQAYVMKMAPKLLSITDHWTFYSQQKTLFLSLGMLLSWDFR